MIVGLAGVAQSGKSTIAAILTEEHGFEEITFAAPIKETAYWLNPIIDVDDMNCRLQEAVDSQGWDEAKQIPEVRRTLQELGVSLRALDPDIWVNFVLDKIHAAPWQDFVIPDVRFENEVEALDNVGATLYKVVRPGAGAGVNSGHSSETALDGIDFENVIANTGTVDDLEKIVSEWFAS